MPLPDVTQLTDDELAQLQLHTARERGRRRFLQRAPALADQISRQHLEASNTSPGDPWVQPTGAHDAYPTGWAVTHNGHEWESLTPANVWEPGVSGWRQIPPPDAPPPAWVQPTGAHDAYAIGDRVTHNGQVWVCTISANVWEPGVTGWQVEP